MKSRLVTIGLLLGACVAKGGGEEGAEGVAEGLESTESEESASEGAETGFESGSETGFDTGFETGSETGEAPEPVPPSGPPIPADPDAPPIVYFVGEEVWRIAADGSDAAPLGLSAFPGGGNVALHYGTNYATVSRDGTRMAYLDADAVMVAALDEDPIVPEMVFALPPNTWTRLLITTWSPDSSTLLAFALEVDVDDTDEAPPPLPNGFELGAYVVDATSMTASHTEQVWGWLEWAGDADVLANVDEWDEQSLLRYSLAGGEPTLVRESENLHGFHQLHVAGDRMVWNDAMTSQMRIIQTQVTLASLLGGEAVPLGPVVGWGDIQFPLLAPTVDRVLIKLESKQGAISEGTDAPQLLPLTVGVGTRWEGDQHLLAVTDEGLVRVDIHGNTTILDPAATALPLQ